MSKKDVYALSSVSIMSFVIPSKAFTMLYRCDLKYWKAFPPIRELSSELCYNILQMVSIRVTSASQPGEESRTATIVGASCPGSQGIFPTSGVRG